MDVKANLIIFFTSICSLVGIGGLLAFFAARAARKERTADAKKADQELAEKAAKQAREEFAKKVPITSIPGDVVVAGDLATGEVSFENRAIVDLFVDYKNKEEMLKSYVRAMNAGTSYLKHFLTYGTSSRWQRGGLRAFFAARARKDRTADAKKAELAEKAAKQAWEEFAKKVPISSIPGDVVVAGDLATGEVSFENRAIVDLFVDYKNKEEMLKSYVRAMNAGTSYLKHFLTSAEIEKHTYGTSSRWQRTGPRSLGDAEIQKIPFVSSWDEFVARINSEEIQQKKEE